MTTRKKKIEVEPFSMVPRVSYGTVKARREDGQTLPAINVKPPPLYQRMPAALQRADQRVIDYTYNHVVGMFWEDARYLAEHHLGRDARVAQVGRSGGWLVVRGIGDPSSWSEKVEKNWARFEARIKKLMIDSEKKWHAHIRAEMRAR